MVIGKLGLFHLIFVAQKCVESNDTGTTVLAIILPDQPVRPLAGGGSNCRTKPPIVADWRTLFAEYPIVGEKFQTSDKFV